MFGVMLEGIVGGTLLMLPSSSSSLMAMTSRGLGPLGRSHVHSRANGRASNRITSIGRQDREREKGDHQAASLGDFAKSPFATARGATPSLHVFATPSRRRRHDLPFRGANRVRQGGGGLNNNLT
jgi:hypothetical protein